jgi:Colicin V production protein
MVDLLILMVLSWCVWLGWQRGFLRTCVDAMALIVPMFLVTLSTPFLKGVLVDRGWNLALAKWMAGHLVNTSPQSSGYLDLSSATPVVQGLGPGAPEVVERFYELALLGLMSGAVCMGLQMIVRVYETLWRDRQHDMWQTRMAGAALGMGVGLTVSTYLVSVLGLVCWIRGMEWLDSELMNSVFMHALYRMILW